MFIHPIIETDEVLHCTLGPVIYIYTVEPRSTESCLSLCFVAITEDSKLCDSNFKKNKVYLAHHYKDGKHRN